MIISTNFVRSPYQVQFSQYIDVYSKNRWFGTCPVPKKIRIGSKYAKVMCHKWSPIESISSRWYKLKCTAGLSLLQAGTCSQCLVQMSVVACCLSASLATECLEWKTKKFCRSIACFGASSLQPFQGCQRSEAQVLPEVPLRGDELKCCSILHAYEIQCTTAPPEKSRNKVMMTKLGHVRAKTKYQDQQDCAHLAVKGQEPAISVLFQPSAHQILAILPMQWNLQLRLGRWKSFQWVYCPDHLWRLSMGAQTDDLTTHHSNNQEFLALEDDQWPQNTTKHSSCSPYDADLCFESHPRQAKIDRPNADFIQDYLQSHKTKWLCNCKHWWDCPNPTIDKGQRKDSGEL